VAGSGCCEWRDLSISLTRRPSLGYRGPRQVGSKRCLFWWDPVIQRLNSYEKDSRRARPASVDG
jgi:hypothetical protein